MALESDIPCHFKVTKQVGFPGTHPFIGLDEAKGRRGQTVGLPRDILGSVLPSYVLCAAESACAEPPLPGPLWIVVPLLIQRSNPWDVVLRAVVGVNIVPQELCSQRRHFGRRLESASAVDNFAGGLRPHAAHEVRGYPLQLHACDGISLVVLVCGSPARSAVEAKYRRLLAADVGNLLEGKAPTQVSRALIALKSNYFDKLVFEIPLSGISCHTARRRTSSTSHGYPTSTVCSSSRHFLYYNYRSRYLEPSHRNPNSI